MQPGLVFVYRSLFVVVRSHLFVGARYASICATYTVKQKGYRIATVSFSFSFVVILKIMLQFQEPVQQEFLRCFLEQQLQRQEQQLLQL